MITNTFKLTVPSDQPKHDAEVLNDSLHSSSGSKWPLPGRWVVGYKRDRVVVLATIPWTKVRKVRRVGLFRFKDEVVDAPQLDFAHEQLRQRWPSSMPRPTIEQVTV